MPPDRKPSAATPFPTRPVAFVRDDDVTGLTAELETFVRLFATAGIPVSYQIIPEAFTAECARFLLDQQRAWPGLIEFGQHGLKHRMQVRGRTVFREFGPGRSYADQLADIREGQAILQARLGEAAPSVVFTPPQHRYDAATVRALAASGFEVLSAAAYADPARRFVYAVAGALGAGSIGGRGVPRQARRRREAPLLELSIAVACDDATTIRVGAQEIETALARAAAASPVVGLMFHHAAYATPERAEGLVALVERLARTPGVEWLGVEACWRRLAGR